MKLCKFDVETEGRFDKALANLAADTIIRAAGRKDMRTFLDLKDFLGMDRSRISRTCHALGIYEDVRQLLRAR